MEEAEAEASEEAHAADLAEAEWDAVPEALAEAEWDVVPEASDTVLTDLSDRVVREDPFLDRFFGGGWFHRPYYYGGGGCLGGLMGMLIAPIILIMIVVIGLVSIFGTAVANLSNGGQVYYNERDFQDYANQQYINEFGKIAKESSTVVVPADVADVAGFIKAAASTLKRG